MTENNLKIYVDTFFDGLKLSEDTEEQNYKGMLKANIDLFFDKESLYHAYNVYETFLSIYQITSESDSKNIQYMNDANIPFDCVKTMFKYESMSKERPYDSLIHSVNVFLLGLAIYAQNRNYREIFEENIKNSPYLGYYINNDEISSEEFLYRWGITSLFQNIAINIEVIGKSLQKLLNEELNTIINRKGDNILLDLLNFQKLDSSIQNKTFRNQYIKEYSDAKFLEFKYSDMLTHKLYLNFKLNKRQQNHLKNIIERLLIDCSCAKHNSTDYSVISAIIILNIYEYLIQKYDRNPDLFFYPILDSATAILLKNFYKDTLQEEPFELKQLNPNQNPLAFLLILSHKLMKPIKAVEVDKRQHKIEPALYISDDKLDLKYVVKKGTININSDDVKQELKNVLDLSNIFHEELTLETSMESEELSLRDKMKSELDLPNLPMNLVYNLAEGIHDQYVKVIEDAYNEAKEDEIDIQLQESYDNLCEFEELPLDLKITNLRLARLIPKELSLIGYELAYESDNRTSVNDFSEDEINDIAILKHEEWVEEKKGTGWTYDSVKSNKKRTNPYLVSWKELNEELQQNNIDTARSIPQLIDSIELKIVPTNKRELAQEIHNFYHDYDESYSFDKLSSDVKYYNFKHMGSSIKRLRRKGYKIVTKEDEGKAITSIEEEIIEYLSEKEHQEWMEDKRNNRWIYGKTRDETKRTNPYMVDWEKLDPKKQEENRITYRNYPLICDNVGLKIIKE
ncbi:RyR domain-containing protein [Methanosphaera sp. BMS]|uniref:RyR domain-containing protein n=1 Tax=Methanosphaera sp. BMS TaxID=1789762 RepID=UPI000DC1E30E|nr:RyR domain-containing protein [Methanosphaera sp. BMS]AWX31688.1 hypothetical protein AW729_00675 [Methanosphaera sp. BMS]